VARAVFLLDRWLRKRQSIYEYTDDPECLFRAELAVAEYPAVLTDGTVINKGAPVVKLHIWNEQMPAMRLYGGASIAWAREVSRRIGPSLRQLDRHISELPQGDGIVAVYGEMGLGTAGRGDQLVRLIGRYGFEPVGDPGRSRFTLRRLGENILTLLLVLAANPTSARLSVLLYDRKPVYLSRKALSKYCRALPDAAAERENEG
jgi:hypothetical protein